LAAADNDPLIHLVSATYYLPSAVNGYYWIEKKKRYGHDVHLAADGQRWLGEQFAKVLWQINVDKKEWQPLRPLSATAEDAGKTIRIAFHVPVPPLVLDQDFLPAQRSIGNQGDSALLGFEVLDQQDVAQEGAFYLACDNQPRLLVRATQLPAGQLQGEPVLSVDVSNSDFAGNVTGLHCRGERTYGYGNLRDSDASASFYGFAHGPRKGQKYPLFNWSVMFDQLKVAM